MSPDPALEPRPFTVAGDGHAIEGASTGPADGAAVVLAHGLTATREVVVHGSRMLPRKGFRTIAFDARGHGDSDPAPEGGGYSFAELADDLRAVLDAEAAGRPAVLAGHSMGAHTLSALALSEPERAAGLVLIGPAYDGSEPAEASLAYWDALAAGLSTGGVEGFLAAYDRDLAPEWRETLLRIARQRLERHRHPDAVARALREVPRSRPFGGLADLETLDVPALVVASHDEADPGHPYEVAAEWARRLPRGTLISEDPGESPLAWQGGRLSREIAAFCETAEVAERL